nr:MAG TPA: hypothetical protein [Caudoviricetes sp.]
MLFYIIAQSNYFFNDFCVTFCLYNSGYLNKHKKVSNSPSYD